MLPCDKIKTKLAHLCLQPIRIFCLHHVCAKFDASSMCEGDWMEIGEFQAKVLQMQQSGVEFISLLHAHELLKASSAPFSTLYSLISNLFRRKKYAVLTFDDGYKSLDEILSWLIEQNIPVTLFINGKYTDGKSQRQVEGKQFFYLTMDELKHSVEASNGLISLQSHGWEHLDATAMSPDAFREQIDKNRSLISTLSSLRSNLYSLHSTPAQPLFHAYTWGRHNAQTDAILKENHIIPVYMDGKKNYNDASCIHRELLEIYDK